MPDNVIEENEMFQPSMSLNIDFLRLSLARREILAEAGHAQRCYQRHLASFVIYNGSVQFY